GEDWEETNSENNDSQEHVQANSKAPKEEPGGSDQFADPTSGAMRSGFGGRDSPGGFGSSDHKGIDISTSKGSTVSASASGVISTVNNGCSEVDSSCGGGFGNFIVVTHNIDGNTYSALYAHLSTTNVSEGDEVSQGDTIGEVGNTG